eukprot:14657870-Alexandrium_andersonii.AAC.1
MLNATAPASGSVVSAPPFPRCGGAWRSADNLRRALRRLRTRGHSEDTDITAPPGVSSRT